MTWAGHDLPHLIHTGPQILRAFNAHINVVQYGSTSPRLDPSGLH